MKGAREGVEEASGEAGYSLQRSVFILAVFNVFHQGIDAGINPYFALI
jgi:hypothetical protein